jgi:Tfp pilus assembly protein PilV
MLLEVILATFIITVGLFAMIDGLNRCIAAARSVQNYTVAETLLANKSYEFRVERPTDMLDQNGVFDDYPGFSWSRTFESVDLASSSFSSDNQGLWKQTITVYWMERGNPSVDSVVEYRYLPQKQR